METILENQEMSRYLRVYNYYKELILSEKLVQDVKLPSIRKAAVQFQMSRTTLESAYLLLAAEGYIISKPQSGYYVTDIAQKQKKSIPVSKVSQEKEKEEIQYDFVTSSVDRDSFKFETWRRYMKSALRQDERLLSYGEPQGEEDFREVLCGYLQKERSVVCTPEQIVVGAGMQSLLHILCPLLRDRQGIAFYDKEFLQGHAIFEDFGYSLCGDYREKACDIYYIAPSQMTKWGGVMTIKARMELIREAAKKELLLIEDDYNNEFCYFQKPMPSLQGLAGGHGVVYLGTFSKMLLPSIRMSYMVLPPELLEIYEERKNRYNQTASKAEQIAITQFIRDGHLAGQIRKSRKIHLAKATELSRVAEKVFEGCGEAEIDDTGFYVSLWVKTDLDVFAFAEKAKKKGVAVLPQPENKRQQGVLVMLNCANVAVEDYESAMLLLKECL